jgi:hypothetical protein
VSSVTKPRKFVYEILEFLVLNSKQYVLLKLSDRKLALNREIISESVLVVLLELPLD